MEYELTIIYLFIDSLWYVHAYPVDAVRFGITELAPRYFGGPPDLVLAGPNEGSKFVTL